MCNLPVGWRFLLQMGQDPSKMTMVQQATALLPAARDGVLFQDQFVLEDMSSKIPQEDRFHGFKEWCSERVPYHALVHEADHMLVDAATFTSATLWAFIGTTFDRPL